MSSVKIGVMGAAGRMGLSLIQAVAAREGAVLVSAVESSGSDAVGRDAGELAGLEACGVLVGDEPRAAIELADAILDFTRPEPTLAFAKLAAHLKRVHIVGTTGFSADQETQLSDLAAHIAMVKAGNMSLGVNLLTALTRKVAAALDEDFDVEILEMHHRHKVDAPSGTALMLGQAAADGRNTSLADAAVRVRDGHTGPRRRGDIGFATLRGGSVIGEHSAIFAADGERVVLSHIATDRGVFARGAVAAALWAHGRKPGLYSMMDVLGFSDADA